MLMLRLGVPLAASGIALGLAGAVVMRRLIASQLHEISPFDWGRLHGRAAVAVCRVGMSSLAPAMVAARVDPAVMLRSE